METYVKLTDPNEYSIELKEGAIITTVSYNKSKYTNHISKGVYSKYILDIESLLSKAFSSPATLSLSFYSDYSQLVLIVDISDYTYPKEQFSITLNLVENNDKEFLCEQIRNYGLHKKAAHEIALLNKKFADLEKSIFSDCNIVKSSKPCYSADFTIDMQEFEVKITPTRVTVINKKTNFVYLADIDEHSYNFMLAANNEGIFEIDYVKSHILYKVHGYGKAKNVTMQMVLHKY